MVARRGGGTGGGSGTDASAEHGPVAPPLLPVIAGARAPEPSPPKPQSPGAREPLGAPQQPLPKQPSLAARRSLSTRRSAGPPPATAASAAAAGGDAHRQATPLLLVILWTSMASIFVAGYASGLTRRWLLSLPGLAEALTERRCGAHTCSTPDAWRDGALHRAFFSGPSVSLLVGAALGAWLLKSHGRRTALLAAYATYIVAFVVATAARGYGMLLVGSLAGEISNGAVVVAVVVVDAELAPPRRRLAFVALTTAVAFGVGSLCASCLALAQIALPDTADVWFWRVITAFGAWPCLLLLTIVPFVPESPLLLVQQGRTAEAMQTLQDLRGPFADTKDEFTGIIHECAEAQVDDARMRRGCIGSVGPFPQQLRQLLSWRHRPAFAVALLVGALDGVAHTADNLAGFLEVAVRPAFDQHWVWTLARFVQSFAIPIGGLLFIACNPDRFDRRKLLAASTAVIVAALAGLAVIEGQPYGGATEPPYPKPLAAATFTLSGVAALAYHAVLSPVSFLVPAELTGTGLRGAAVAANFMFSRLCRLMWGLIADSPGVTARLYLASTLTGALSLALAVLCWLFVPEGTECMPLEECRHAWQKHWYWGKHAERWAFDLPHRRSSRQASLKHSPSIVRAGDDSD